MPHSPQQSSPTTTASPGSSHALPGIATLIYVLLLVYGTLFPLSGWQWPDGGLLNPRFPAWPEKLHSSDVLTNLLVYMPLGLLLGVLLRQRFSPWGVLILATSLGTGLSFLLEYLQTYLPLRVSSLADILLNGLGSLAGAGLLVLMNPGSSLQRRLLAFKHFWFKEDPLSQLGLVVLVLWATAQLFPLVPSLDMASLRAGLKPLWYTLNDIGRFEPWRTGVYALNITGLGLLTRHLLREGRPLLPLFGALVMTVLLLKVLVVGRQLSLEALGGAALGLLMLLLVRGDGRAVATLALCGAFLLEALQSGTGSATRAMNWIPFLGHMQSVLDMVDIITTAWPFVALAWLGLSYKPPRPMTIAVSGGLLVCFGTLTVEWLQQSLPGRYPDITDVALATLGWGLPWWYFARRFPRPTGQGVN